MNKLGLITLVLFCGLLGAVAQILFKVAAKGLTFSLHSLLDWRLLTGMAAYALAMCLFLFALRFGQVSRLYPLIASSYIFVAVLAYVFLREHITSTTIIGIAFITLGITVLAWQVQR